MEARQGGSGRSLQRWLGSLRDIEGILGSCVVSAEGDIIEADFSPAFAAIAASVGQRVARLRDTLSLEGGQVSMLTVRYPHHKLALRSVSGGVLVVLAVATVNDAALRSAMHLVGQQCVETGADFHVFRPAPSVRVEATQTLRSSIVQGGRAADGDAGPLSEASSANGTSDRPSYSDRPSVNPLPPEAGLPSSSRKPRSVLFRGKRIG
jgi:predicted regulator of Ras-like GTPase activity (Roadblock/LC7/MglB family)